MTVLGLTLMALLILPSTAWAQLSPAGVVTTIEGSVTAARRAVVQPVPLKFKDAVFLDDRITTGDRSLARVLLGGKALVTVRERSVLHITEVPGRSTVAVDSGKMALTVARERMRPGESIEIRTPNAVAAVRGTALVVEVIRATTQAGGGTAGSTTVFYGFTGSTTITFSDGTTGTLGPNQFFSQTGNGPVSSGTMTASQRSDALSGLQPTNQPLTSGNDGGAKDTAVAQTAALTAAVGGNVLSTVKLNAQPPLYNNLINPCSSVSGSQACGPAAQAPPAPSPPPPSLPVAKPATGILIFGDNLEVDPSARAALASDLRSLGHGVITNVDRLPGDISAYGTIWQVSAFAPLTPAEQTELAGHLARGGGLHLTGEHPCCDDPHNDSLTAFLRSVVVKGGNIVVGRQGDVGGAYAFNPTAAGHVTSSPNTLTRWMPDLPGGIAGIFGANVLVTSQGPPATAVGGVWDASDLVGGAGHLTLLMDVNWFTGDTSQQRLPIIENIEHFIDDPEHTLTLNGPLMRSVSERLTSDGVLLDIFGYTVIGRGRDPLIWADGSTLGVAAQLVRMSDSAVVTDGSFLRADNGARLIQTGVAADPFVSMSGGSLLVGNGPAGGNLFEIAGRPTALQTDADADPVSGTATGLVFGSDRPLQPGASAPVFDMDNGATAVVNGRAYKVDTALLEATAPLLNLKNGSALTTLASAIDLTNRAKLTMANDAAALVSLNQSLLTVASGHLVNVASGSRLNVAGDLVSLAGGSQLSILNGLLLNVTGGSVASVGGSLVRFTGSGNLVSVTNSLAPSAIIGGIPVYGNPGSFKITGNPLAGLGTAGTILINGVTLTPATAVSKLTGSLVAIQGSGSVRIGP